MHAFCPCCKYGNQITTEKIGERIYCAHCETPFFAECGDAEVILPEDEAGKILLGDRWKPRPSGWRKVSINNTMVGIVAAEEHLPELPRAKVKETNPESEKRKKLIDNSIAIILGAIFLLSLIVAFSFIISSAGTGPTRFIDKFESVRPGMTAFDVEKILGKPDFNLGNDGQTIVNSIAATRAMVYQSQYENFIIYISDYRVVYTERKWGKL